MWKELTAEDLRAKAAANAIVVLPVASMEQHGPHLPVGVDTFLCEAVCQARRRARREGRAGGGRADAVVRHGRAPHGVRRHVHVRHPDLSGGAVGVPQQHQAARLHSACSSSTATAATSRRSTPSCRTSRARPGCTLYATTYFELSKADLAQFLEDQKSVHHACEVETSMMMVVAPDDREARPPARSVRHAQRRPAQGLSGVALSIPFKDLTPSGVVGDARRANAQKGEKLLGVSAPQGLAATLKNKRDVGLKWSRTAPSETSCRT